MPIINGVLVREIRCKNDNCRKLLGYEKAIKAILLYECPRCGIISEFRINYGNAKQNFDTVRKAINELQKGGEK